MGGPYHGGGGGGVQSRKPGTYIHLKLKNSSFIFLHLVLTPRHRAFTQLAQQPAQKVKENNGIKVANEMNNHTFDGQNPAPI